MKAPLWMKRLPVVGRQFWNRTHHWADIGNGVRACLCKSYHVIDTDNRRFYKEWDCDGDLVVDEEV